MPIYFALVGRRRSVLCDHVHTSGNYEALAQSILDQLPVSDTRISYESGGRFLFHVMVSSGLTFLCVTEATFERAAAYNFLAEVQRRLRSDRLEDQARVAGPYAMRATFAPTLRELVERYSRTDTVTNLQEKVDEVRGIMTENIEKVLSRGEALQDISERSEVLMQNSTLFRTNSTRLRRHLCCQSYRRWACCIAVLVAVLLLVVVVAVIAALATTGKFKNN